MESIRFLAQRAGMQVPEEAGDDRSARLRKRILELNRDAARYFHRNLMSEAGRPGRAYLIGRGLTKATITHFGIGYASEGWNGLTDAMKKLGYTKEELLAAHLANEGQRGGYYDIFRNRAIFPIIDLRGNVIAFGGRNLGEKGPKYLNSSDTPVFKKSRNLFALNFAKGSDRKELILCEGYMDVVSMHQAGFTNAVATLGTALTEEQSRLIAQYTGEVVLSYDSDAPGQTATRRATGLLEAAGVKIRVLSIPDAKDPDEFIKKFGAERFAQLIEGSSSATDFAINKLRQENDVTTAEGKVSFLKQFAALMAGLPNPIEREVYLSKVCRELEVDKAAVAGQIAREQKRRGAGSHRAADPGGQRQGPGGRAAAAAAPPGDEGRRTAAAVPAAQPRPGRSAAGPAAGGVLPKRERPDDVPGAIAAGAFRAGAGYQRLGGESLPTGGGPAGQMAAAGRPAGDR